MNSKVKTFFLVVFEICTQLDILTLKFMYCFSFVKFADKVKIKVISEEAKMIC